MEENLSIRTASADRFRRLKEESEERMDSGELLHGEFLAMLLDVWEHHLEEGDPADIPREASVPEYLKCYCVECGGVRKHDKGSGSRRTAVSLFSCRECGSRVAIDLLPDNNEHRDS